MFKKDTRRGLALGAAFALIGSLFVVAPAAQADESGVVVTPFSGTSYNMLITEAFTLKTRLGSSQDDSKISRVRYEISKPAGYGVSVSNTVSQVVLTGVSKFDGGSPTNSIVAASNTTVSDIIPSGATVDNINQLIIQPYSTSAITSVSPAVSVTVTAYLDLTPNGDRDADEPFETVTINFVKWSSMAATLDLTTPSQGDVWVTASAAVSAVNTSMLEGDFQVYFNAKGQSQDGALTYAGASASANITGAQLALGTNALSHSEEVTALSAGTLQTVSAVLVYGGTAAGNILAYSTKIVSANTFDDVTISPVLSSNLVYKTTDQANARVNTEFALTTKAFTGSATVAAAVTAAKSLGVVSTGLTTEKTITINGVTYTSSATLPTSSALATGTVTLTVSTAGFAGSENIAFTVTSAAETYTYTVYTVAPTYSVTHSQYLTVTPGSAVNLSATVTDQFDVASSRTNQRVVSHWVATTAFSASASVSAAVNAGTATVVTSPSPASATGSATLRVSLQSQDLGTLLWTNIESNDVTVNVSSVADSFTSSVTASVSSSISYGIAMGTYSWSPAISGTTVNLGSSVVVSSQGLMFQDVATSKTASNTITIKSSATGAFSFKATGTIAGTYDVTIGVGSATTISQVIVDAAGDSKGASISFDTTLILPGSTATVTGTLVDTFGNPVLTSGSATVAVTYTGKGIAIGVMPTETDANGEFSFNVLTGAADSGQAQVVAVYRATGAGATAANTLTAAANITVGTALASTGTKVTIGTYKGYVAVFTKGYAGQKLSVRLASKWHVRNPIVDLKAGYSLLTVNTGAGYVANVIVYIDGVEVERMTITTK